MYKLNFNLKISAQFKIMINNSATAQTCSNARTAVLFVTKIVEDYKVRSMTAAFTARESTKR